MIAISKKGIDRSIVVLTIVMFVMAAALVFLTVRANLHLNSIKEDLDQTAIKIDDLNNSDWVQTPQYDVWIADNNQAGSITSGLLKDRSSDGNLKALQYVIKRDKGAPLIVFYVTDSKSVNQKAGSQKALQLTTQGKATIDSVINETIRDRMDPALQAVIVTDMNTSTLIDSTKDAPIKKVASITTGTQSTTAAKGRDVKVVQYN